jgi:oligopeptidase A
MERWCYDRTTLYSFAKHWQTHRPLPPDKFEKICQQKVFNAGMTTCKQLYFGQLDLELHGNYDPEKNTIFDIQKEVALHYVPHALPLAEDRFLCSFSHIFAGGYSAGYYSYLWAEVMSADAFCAFEDAGLEDDEEVQRIGRLFRDTFLSLGGGVPPKEVFEQFRGRQPTPGALLRHLGLSPDDRSISQQKADNYTMQP